MKTTNIFIVGAVMLGALNMPAQNTLTGTGAGASITSGTADSFFGYVAGNKTTSGSGNSAVGDSALYSNTIGINNCSTGYLSMLKNTTGGYNTADGFQALKSNANGSFNVAFGGSALRDNTTSNNTALGYAVLYRNTTGTGNTGVGGYAISTNTTGNFNTAMGNGALNSLNSNDGNSAFGYHTMYNITVGSGNTSIGFVAGNAITTGSLNTFIGYQADAGGSSYTNCGAFGYGAIANGNDQIRMGNVNATLYCQGGVWTGSDGRFKKNVKEDVKGIEFIKRLRPVTYNFDSRMLEDHVIQNLPDSVKRRMKEGMDFSASTGIVHSGFIAQEVEKASQESGFSNSIVHKPSNNADYYSLSYQEIVVPLVKAVQEQQSMIDSLKKQVAQLSQLVKATGTSGSSPAGANAQSVQLGGDVAMLGQNVPNPFGDQTIINYNVPHNTGSAQITFADQNGTVIKTVDIRTKGKGQLSVLASDLGSGLYTYTLMIDGRAVDTKKMMKQQ